MFGFNEMNEEEFRREFMKFLTMYQPSLESFIKKTYLKPSDLEDLNNQVFFRSKNLNTDFIPDFTSLSNKDLNIEKGSDEHGDWEKKTWSSPDGRSSYASFTRSFNSERYFKDKKQTKSDDTHTLALLEQKLDKSIREEKYEDAAKIRDLIKSIKEDLNK